MPPPIFHIGYHKTATTWFETRLYAAASNVRSVPREVTSRLLIEPRAFEFDAEAARRTFDGPGPRAVVCHEELSGNIHTGGMRGLLAKEVAGRIHSVAPTARIVVLLRNQIEIVASAYRQYVRVGGTYGVDRYLHHPEVRPSRAALFDLGHFDYGHLLRHYSGLFGRARLAVYLYEDFRSGGKAFISAFARDLDLEIDIDAVDLAPVLTAYGDGTLLLARGLNAFTRDALPYKHHLVHVPGLYPWTRAALGRLDRVGLLSRKRSARELLGDRNVTVIEERFAGANSRVAAEYGLAMSRHGYPLADARGAVAP